MMKSEIPIPSTQTRWNKHIEYFSNRITKEVEVTKKITELPADNN